MSFHVAPLNPVSGTRKFLPELCPELPSKFGRGIGCTGGDHRITIWSELVPLFPLPCHRSFPALRTVRFESSNRCPPSLEPPAFKLSFVPEDGRELIFQLSAAGCNISVKVTRCLILGYITSAARTTFVESHNFSYAPNRSSIYRRIISF